MHGAWWAGRLRRVFCFSGGKAGVHPLELAAQNEEVDAAKFVDFTRNSLTLLSDSILPSARPEGIVPLKSVMEFRFYFNDLGTFMFHSKGFEPLVWRK